MMRRIELVVSVPVASSGIFRSGSVVSLEKEPRPRHGVGKCFSHAGVACPCAYGIHTERTLLSIELGVVVEVLWERTLYVKTNGDFIEVSAADLFLKVRVRGCDAPENIGFERGLRNEVLEASVH